MHNHENSFFVNCTYELPFLRSVDEGELKITNVFPGLGFQYSTDLKSWKNVEDVSDLEGKIKLRTRSEKVSVVVISTVSHDERFSGEGREGRGRADWKYPRDLSISRLQEWRVEIEWRPLYYIIAF